MLKTGFFIKLLVVALFGNVCALAAQDGLSPLTLTSACTNKATRAQIFKRERQFDGLMAGATPNVKTEIRISRDPFLLLFRATRLHFSERVDFSQPAGANRRSKGERAGNFLWKFEPSGFADRAFLDPGRVTQDYYQLSFLRFEPCDDQTCCVYQITPTQTARNHQAGPLFSGTIWVETDEYTIIHFKGQHVPASRLHFPLTINLWFEFESWRVKVAPHIWLPNRVISRNTGKDRDLFFPEFESETIFSDFKLRQPETPINVIRFTKLKFCEFNP